MLLPLLLLSLAALPQDAATAATPQAPATAITAEEALARAVAAQTTTGLAHRVEHFAIDLNLRERGEAPREVEITLQYDSRRGGRLQLVLDDSERGGVRVEKGYDGERYWLKEQDREPILLVGRDYARDRQVIDDTLELCEELLLLFDLERLQARTKELELGSGSLRLRGQQRPQAVLRGTITLADQRRGFALWLDRESWLPSRLVLDPPAPAAGTGGSPAAELPLAQEFDLQHYYDFPLLGSEEPQGRLLPRTVKEYRRDGSGQRREVRVLEMHQVQWRLPPRIRRISDRASEDSQG